MSHLTICKCSYFLRKFLFYSYFPDLNIPIFLLFLCYVGVDALVYDTYPWFSH